MTTDLENQIITYFAARPEAAAVYLFGSYAAGHQRPTSDLDIGILFTENEREHIENHIYDYLKDLPRITRKDIHPVVMNTAGELLAKQILSRGRCIHVKDKRQLAQYKMIMFSRIAEFAYYRKQILPGFVNKMMKGS